MSDRGSYCTEYMYCTACFEAALACLGPHGGMQVDASPIIAGYVKSSYAGGEVAEVGRWLESMAACHPVRVAVIAEEGFELIEVGVGIAPKTQPQENAPSSNDR